MKLKQLVYYHDSISIMMIVASSGGGWGRVHFETTKLRESLNNEDDEIEIVYSYFLYYLSQNMI